MENPADEASSGGDGGASLAALGGSLISESNALQALAAAQANAEAIARTANVAIGREAALGSALAAARAAKMQGFDLKLPSLRITEHLQQTLTTMQSTAFTTDRLRLDLPRLQIQWGEFLRSWQGVNESITRSIARAARGIDWDSVIRGVIDVQEIHARHELIAAFRRARLLPAPSMPRELVEQVREAYRNGAGPSALSNIVSGRYGRTNWELLSRIGGGWHEVSYLEARTELLREAHTAMRAKLYLLVAPALVPQIEGVSVDFLRSVTGSGKVSHSALSSTLAQTVPANAAMQVGIAAVEGFLTFVEEELFAFVDFEKTARRDGRHLNRHVLLHGRDLRQATRMNGLRAFILLDVLGAIAQEVERQTRSR